MKHSLMILVCLACWLAAGAQSTSLKSTPARRMALELTGGYAVPTGKFASSDRTEAKAGFAGAGWLVQAGFIWMGKKDLGLGIQYTFQRNPMTNAVNYVYPNGDPSLASGSWTNHALMAGPVYKKQIGRLVIDARVMGGFLFSAGPVFDTPDPADTTGRTVHTNVGTGFGLQLGAGVGYQVVHHLVLRFSLNLTGGWPSKTREYRVQLIGYEWETDPETGLKTQKPIYSAPRGYEIRKVVTTLTPALGLVFDF